MPRDQQNRSPSLYILSVFLSAFLLFQIQPIMGKVLLPWFGGTSGVWSTILLFFQTLLTGGYAYAYWLIGLNPRAKQWRTHLGLLTISLVIVGSLSLRGNPPIVPDITSRPINSRLPIWEILELLILYSGVPVFVIAANSTLIQSWFNFRHPQKSPYWLYALSNAGSLIALVSYPFLIEPNFALQNQAWIWVCGYLLFFLSTGALIMRLIRSPDSNIDLPLPVAIDEEEGRLSRAQPLLWIGLSAAASILLLSTTSHLTQEVAPIPLLWVLPLGIYLLSFVLSFSGEGFYSRPLFTILLTISSAAVIYDMVGSRLHYLLQIMIYSSFLFSACLIAHGELFRLRPDPARLSKFYLYVSVGGALGGIFVNLIAPLIFNGYWEFHLGWVLIYLFLMVLIIKTPVLEIKMPWRKVIQAGAVVLPVSFLAFSLYTIINSGGDQLYQERNFYGVSQVAYSQYRDAYQYINGKTMHGFQILADDQREIPTAYFWEGSGIAIMIRNHPKHGNPIKVGVLGLGIGTLAAHAQPGDIYRFYEINPLVTDLALGQDGFFSYLEDSAGEITIVPGDARLSLEQEYREGQIQDFDLLVMDAFSSDSVPTHLITVEAIELYLKHLAPGGVIAINISNNYLDLKPVIWKLSQELGLHPVLIGPPVQAYHPVGVPSLWIFLARDPAAFDRPEIHANQESLDNYHPEIRLWTDQYSNLFQIIR